MVRAACVDNMNRRHTVGATKLKGTIILLRGLKYETLNTDLKTAHYPDIIGIIISMKLINDINGFKVANTQSYTDDEGYSVF